MQNLLHETGAAPEAREVAHLDKLHDIALGLRWSRREAGRVGGATTALRNDAVSLSVLSCAHRAAPALERNRVAVELLHFAERAGANANDDD